MSLIGDHLPREKLSKKRVTKNTFEHGCTPWKLSSKCVFYINVKKIAVSFLPFTVERKQVNIGAKNEMQPGKGYSSSRET